MSEQPAIPSDLPSRIVFSMLQGAVRLAARLGVPLKQVVQLTRLAYYQELREEHPRDRKAVAEKLGVSLRTAAELGKQLKDGFTEPEETLMFARKVRELIDDSPRTEAEILEALGADAVQIEPVMAALAANGWADRRKGRWRVKSAIQSYLGGSLTQKIDGLNRQQDVLADAAWAAFFGEPESATTARTWVFHSDPEAFSTLNEDTLKNLRGQVIELDEQSEHVAGAERVGVTVVFSRMRR